ncbi:MAG: S1C family serine protease [Oscillospiraceae bacterium]|nr:S1C family serine protease [Oscillospiraceae bacterium]
MKKRIVSLLLVFVLLASLLSVSGFAAGRDFGLEERLADSLYRLGLFKGVAETDNGPDYALSKNLTRPEAITMLVRILGKEEEALNGSWSHPFTDVPAWANKYVGYAYANKLTNGISATQFGTGKVQANMYITFVLRALGYTDSGDNSDFSWMFPFAFAKQVGVLNRWVDTENFIRADAVNVSYAALNTNMKGSLRKLSSKLIDSGAFSSAAFNTYYDKNAYTLYEEYEQTIKPVKTPMTAEQVYEKCSSAVFYIEVYDEWGYAFASGSGFFLSSDGVAVTNYHVIDGASSALVITTDGKEYPVEFAYEFNSYEDWALIQVGGSDFNTLTKGNGFALKGGETVFTIGSPLGLQNTISQGIVSNPQRVLDGLSYIQTSAPISHGSSGGALLNAYGELIGITSATFSDGQNLNLAIPIDYVTDYDTNVIYTLPEIYEMMYGYEPEPGNDLLLSPVAIENLNYTVEDNGDVFFDFEVWNYSEYTLSYVDFTIKLLDSNGYYITDTYTGKDSFTIIYSPDNASDYIEPYSYMKLYTFVAFGGGYDYEGTTSFKELVVGYRNNGETGTLYITPDYYYGYWDALY